VTAINTKTFHTDMIILRIKVQAKTSKHLELSQSLDLMHVNLEKLCSSLIISEKNKVFLITSKLESDDCLNNILNSKEMKILSGTLKVLGDHTEITIEGLGEKLISSHISGIRSQLLLMDNTELLN